MHSKRETWIDIAKAIGIIAVVLGHGGSELAHHYTYWFHMPLFFILSGLLAKPLTNSNHLFSWLKKRSKQLLIPYFSFGLLIIVYKVLMHNNYYDDFGLMVFLEDIYNLAYGGLMIYGIMTVFWFITCLLLTQILFALIQLFIKSKVVQIGIVLFTYLLAHGYAIFIADTIETPIPWSADVVLIALAYYAFGFYVKQYMHVILNIKAFLVSLIFITAFIIYDFRNNFFYSLDLKPNQYNHVFLDFFVPLSLFIIVIYISLQLSKIRCSNVIAKLGMSSLTIMFLHRLSNEILGEFLEYAIIWYTLVGVFVPFIIHILFEKTSITRYLFLGISLVKADRLLEEKDVKQQL